MEIILFLLLIVVIVMVARLSGSVNDKMRRLESEVNNLRRELFNFIQPKMEAPPPSPTYPAVVEHVEEVKVPEQPVVSEIQEEVLEEPAAPPVAIVEEKPAVARPGFFERHPDLEKFIGENLVSKIGIAVLVLAIAYFVKYAIDNDWIGPVGRVAVGILCGGILTGVAHYLRASYKAFSSVLVGGGLAIFYFTMTLAYQQFHLFSQITTFIIMMVITIFAVCLSLAYNRQELAIIALVGGMATPFMASADNGDYNNLFRYLIILNSGLLFIAYHKAWRLLNLLSFIFTVILFGSWLWGLAYPSAPVIFRNGLIYASIFYLLFLLINIANNIRENKKFLASDFGILLANTGLYFSAGLYCLAQMHEEHLRGLFTIVLSIFNLAVTFWLLRTRKADKNILYLLIGITLTFISLTAPLQLNGHFITLFWAAESVLLYWLYQRSRIKLLTLTSFIVWLCMLVSLLLDWLNSYQPFKGHTTIIFNRGFITSLMSAIATYLLFILHTKDSKASFPGSVFFRAAAIVLLYFAGLLELNYQFGHYYPGTGVSFLYMQGYTFGFVFILAFISSKLRNLRLSPLLAIILVIVSLLAYLTSIGEIFAIQRGLLKAGLFHRQFFAHWAGAVFVALLFYRCIALLRREEKLKKFNKEWTWWVFCLFILIYLSAELHLAANSFFYSSQRPLSLIQSVWIRAGWPILWGLCSFVFMWIGMKHRWRTLRIISLTLFSVTLLKLFVYDIRNIPAGGKIAAFFCLGVLLLIVSFMYQRLKKIIIDHDAEVIH